MQETDHGKVAFELHGYPGTEDHRVACLVRGLVGRDYFNQYMSSPEFKMSIDVLARLLTEWVPGLSQKAVTHEAAMAAIRESLERGGKLPELKLEGD